MSQDVYDVTVIERAHYTRVRIMGEPTLDQLLSMIHLLGVESGGWEHEVLLVDLRGIQGRFSNADQFQIGLEIACSLSHLRKIASVVPPGRVSRICEKAARRNGTNVRMFDDEKAAVAWLKG